MHPSMSAVEVQVDTFVYAWHSLLTPSSAGDIPNQIILNAKTPADGLDLQFVVTHYDSTSLYLVYVCL